MTARAARIACLAALAVAVYARNLDDYFVGDDFDLIQSFHGEPPSYFLKLLWYNESGAVWKSLGLDPEQGGFLRPVKIWTLKLDLELWGPRAAGFHATATALFVANVLLVFGLLDLLLPGQRGFAVLGAASVAIHPVFAEIVPCITFREETMASGFGLAALFALVRHRLAGRSALPVLVLVPLALLSKESAIVTVPLLGAYDAAQLLFARDRLAELLRRVRLYVPLGLIVVGYFGLRTIAFGDPIGGFGDSRYESQFAFLSFHRKVVGLLFDPTMLALSGLPLLAPAVGLAALVALGAVLAGWRRLPPGALANLLFVGPLWYLACAAVWYGTYFVPRHNGMIVIGLLCFAAVLLAGMVRALGRGERAVLVAAAALAAIAFLPPTLRLSAAWDRASQVVERVRAEIEAETADLPPGSTVRLVNVPQSGVRPYYFGWGLLSALKQPFTASDLARHSQVVNLQNIALNQYPTILPERFDRVVRIEGQWEPPPPIYLPRFVFPVPR